MQHDTLADTTHARPTSDAFGFSHDDDIEDPILSVEIDEAAEDDEMTSSQQNTGEGDASKDDKAESTNPSEDALQAKNKNSGRTPRWSPEEVMNAVLVCWLLHLDFFATNQESASSSSLSSFHYVGRAPKKSRGIVCTIKGQRNRASR